MYLTGGATAVLEGWRPSTVDVDVRFEPDSDEPLRRIAELKEKLELNVELASPLLPGPFEARARLDLELADVASMVETGLVEKA